MRPNLYVWTTLHILFQRCAVCILCSYANFLYVLNTQMTCRPTMQCSWFDLQFSVWWKNWKLYICNVYCFLTHLNTVIELLDFFFLNWLKIENKLTFTTVLNFSIFQDTPTGGVTLMVPGCLQRVQTRPGSTTRSASNPQSPTKRE